MNRLWAWSWLLAAAVSACHAEPRGSEVGIPEAGVPDAAIPDAAIPDAAGPETGPPDAGDAAPADAAPDASEEDAAPDASEEDAAPPTRALEVARYDYRFELDTGEAQSKLTIEGFGRDDACLALKSEPLLREPTTTGLAGARYEQGGARVSLCGSAGGASAATLTASLTVPEASDPSTGVGFSRRLDSHGNRFSYLLGWVEACARFGPCDPAPNRLAHFTFDVSHAAGETVLCPGTLRVAAGRTTCELLDRRAPSYSSFAVAANSAWVQAPLVSAAGVAVVWYEVPEGRVRAAIDAASVAAFLDWITARLGPFPYGNELRVATAPVPWLGMEHPANIVLREDLTEIQRLYANVPLHALLHELAHQWAGNRTTLADSLDFIWKEAIAEYLVYAFEQEQRPAAESTATRHVWHSTGVGAPYPVRPRVAPEVPLSVWTAGGYGSGPMTLFVQLEPWLGQPALLAGIARFLEGDVRSMTDLRLALEAESGRDLRRYFEAWVFGAGAPEWPSFQVETSPLAAGTRLRVRQEHVTESPFPCVVELELVGTTHSARVRADFGLSPDDSTVVVDTNFTEPVTRVVVDPDKRLLDFTVSSARLAAAELRWHP